MAKRKKPCILGDKCPYCENERFTLKLHRYREALRQAWIDDGCKESEVEEMLEALDG